MSEVLQEFVDSGNERLRVDRAAGIIRGVKLLGLSSRNGRRYRETALTDAVSLYEGAKVNINHPKGHPLSPRDYQDRLGVVRDVHFRSGDGLFGDLHFNPKHALSEQLVWDAEHAPQNVGMSHNVLARTSIQDGGVMVEAITKVQSIDLVADPATTSGLYEHAEGEQPTAKIEHTDFRPTWDELTLDELRRQRPDLLREATSILEQQLQSVRGRFDAIVAQEEASRRRDLIVRLLEFHGLPQPAKGAAASRLISEQFIESLMAAADSAMVERLVQERAALVRSAREWHGGNDSSNGGPRSRDQVGLLFESAAKPIRGGEDFANAVRGR